jgi:hypothetical protein
VAKGEVKEYYSELTDIARNYIEEAIEILPWKVHIRIDVALRAASLKENECFARNDREFRTRFKTSRFSKICQI